MQITNILFSALAAAAAVSGSPVAKREVKSMMAAGVVEWTIESFVRTCNAENTSCDYSFTIDTHITAPTACKFTTTGSPASRAASNAKCGAYTVTSGWSGQFGEDAGFTTFSVTDQKLIVWPAYTDKQLVNGQVVSPDQAYAPQNLP
ncbi:uncharacterized protein ColSpa_09851 [Colletotrichum spaethianum]|uniref:Small secreted protein n=1 Tax=Colletotrichum spaethianum TaxID=700344 RepID=A0AA37PCC9_9PEZI|nr:uncharacterized protein ColSpa_09851 [Colletotrichum spaethianum]GKT49670.1 hypothetical protein ColSpa_09851 [Colletotrichum spaethianum]